MSEIDNLLNELLTEGEPEKEGVKKESKVDTKKEKEREKEVKAVTIEDLHAVPSYIEPQTTDSSPPIVAPEHEEAKPRVEVKEVKVEVKPSPVEVGLTKFVGSEKAKEVIESVEFEIEEEKPVNKYVIMIYGDKGTGKTVTALSFPGEVCVLSFDRKAVPIKINVFNNDSRIHVFDAVKYMDWRPDKVTESSSRTFEYILKILDYCAEKIKPDWIVFDGTEIMEQIIEFAMRHRHGLGPFQGISNLNIWKERRLMLRQIHSKAYEIAKKGIIYTTYTQYEDIVIEGELVTRKEVPKWIDVIMFETDVVLKTEYNARDQVFTVKVVTSKVKALPTGKVYGVTGKPLGQQVNI